MKSILQKSDPWVGGSCGDDMCFPCRGEKGGDCRRNNVTYQIVCEECEKVGVVSHYKGETSKNTEGLEALGAAEEQSQGVCALGSLQGAAPIQGGLILHGKDWVFFRPHVKANNGMCSDKCLQWHNPQQAVCLETARCF